MTGSALNRRMNLTESVRLTKFFLRPYVVPVSISTLLIVASAGAEYLSVAALYNCLNQMMGAATTQPSRVFDAVFRLANLIPSASRVTSAGLFLLAIFVAKSCLALAASYYVERMSQRMRFDLQESLMKRYLSADCSFFSDAKQGNLVYNVSQAPALVCSNISLLANTMMSLMTAVFLIGLLFSISVPVTSLILAFAVAAGGVVAVISKRIAFVEGNRANASLSRINVLLNEAITCIRVIKSFVIGDRLTREFRGAAGDFFKAKMRVTLYRHLVTDFFSTAMVAFFVGFVIIQASRGGSSFTGLLPSLSVYVIALLRVSGILSDLGKKVLDYAHYMPNMRLLHEQLTSASTQAAIDGTRDVSTIDTIEFRDVSFAYDGKRVLSGVSFSISNRQTVAFVGPSGSGKTTLLALILKLYRPDEGMILLNGVDLNDIRTSSVLAKVTPVFQTPLLFNQSVAENVALEDGPAVDRVRLKEALDLAQASEFVDSLSAGVDTEIGDMGDRLSVGQKQRLLLARAFYRRPEMILFDEPTSALDGRSEKLIVSSIRTLSGRKTVVIVAHRLSTIEHADVIHVLRDGRIVESGTHVELSALGGEYASLRSRKQEATH